MAIKTFNNLSVFVISGSGLLVPVSTGEHVEVDTNDFADGEWGLFRNSDGMVNQLEGNLELWDSSSYGGNWLYPNSLKLWYDFHGAISSRAGTYVTVGLFYYSAHQPGIEFTFDYSIAGDGYMAVMADYDTTDIDRKVFWAFSDFNPVVPEPSEFWTALHGAREVL